MRTVAKKLTQSKSINLKQKQIHSDQSKIETNAFRGEFRLQAHDGRYCFFSIAKRPVLSETAAFDEWLLALTDITERKLSDDQTAKDLRELNDLKSAVDEHAIVTVTDAREKSTDVNDKFCAISKYSREELVGER